MRKISIYFFLLSKRLFKKPSFLLLLILIPLLTFFASRYGSSSDTRLTAVFYDESPTDFSEAVSHELLTEDGILHFIRTDSKQALLRMVTAGEAECGYIFTKDFTKEHVLAQKGFQKSVLVKTAPDSILSGMADEVFFSHFFYVYCRELLASHVKTLTVDTKNAQKETSALLNEADASYETYTKNGSTFSFTFADAGQSAASTKEDLVTSSFYTPIRGFFCILILLSAFCGTLLWIQDRQQGISFMGVFPLAEAFVPAFYTGILSLISLCFLHNMNGLLFEISAMICYLLFVTLASTLFGFFFKNVKTFTAFLFTVCTLSVFFSPVFIDLTTYVPAFYILNRISLPSYYLDVFLTGAFAYVPLLFCIVLCALLYCIIERRQRSR